MSENFYEAYIEHGFFYVIDSYGHYIEEMADSNIKQVDLIAKEKLYPFLIDLCIVKSYSRGAKNRVIQEDFGQMAKVVAILFNCKLQEVLYNFLRLGIRNLHLPKCSQIKIKPKYDKNNIDRGKNTDGNKCLNIKF